MSVSRGGHAVERVRDGPQRLEGKSARGLAADDPSGDPRFTRAHRARDCEPTGRRDREDRDLRLGD